VSTRTRKVVEAIRPKVHPLNKPIIILQAREHDESSMRVWRTDWASDQFEIMELQDFNNFNYYLSTFNLPQIEILSPDEN